MEVPALTFPRDPLQAGLGVLLYQHTVVEYLLSMCQARTRESHALIREILNQRLSQMSIQFNCEKQEGTVWGALRASSRGFAEV